MQDICYLEIDQILLIMNEIFYGITLVLKKYHFYTFLRIKDVTKESPYSTKIKYILLIHSQDEHIVEIQQCHVDQKTATTLYN